MIYGSVCSGIEAATVAWEHLGWQAAWYSEIKEFPSAVLSYRYPNVSNLGDMTKLYDNALFRKRTIDLLVGGTPCQSFSLAGGRKGLDDPRGNLALEFLKIASIKKPRWLVWENVPGLLSIDGGRAFGAILGKMAEFGYGFAYRVLDARRFGLLQSRPRVFVVGYFGDWQPPKSVLFDGPSCHNHYQRSDNEAGRIPTLTLRNAGNGNARGVCIVESLVRKDGEIGPLGAADRWQIRSCTPWEEEKRQGFSGEHTLIPGKYLDSDRYEAIGNSMAVPVMKWIGEQIARVEKENHMTQITDFREHFEQGIRGWKLFISEQYVNGTITEKDFFKQAGDINAVSKVLSRKEPLPDIVKQKRGKFTDDIKLAIIKDYATDEYTQGQLAEKYGTSTSTISNITSKASTA